MYRGKDPQASTSDIQSKKAASKSCPLSFSVRAASDVAEAKATYLPVSPPRCASQLMPATLRHHRTTLDFVALKQSRGSAKTSGDLISIIPSSGAYGSLYRAKPLKNEPCQTIGYPSILHFMASNTLMHYLQQTILVNIYTALVEMVDRIFWIDYICTQNLIFNFEN